MRRLADLLDRITRRVGQSVIWLVLPVVFLQFFVVIFRYVFGLNSVDIQETITILHGLIFMLAAGYVLQTDHHVRVDIFYAGLSAKGRAAVNLVGSLVFLLPAMAVIWYFSWPYAAQSWDILEAAPDGEYLSVRYLQKSAILVFAAALAIQGVSIFLRGLLALGGDEQALAVFSKPVGDMHRPAER